MIGERSDDHHLVDILRFEALIKVRNDRKQNRVEQILTNIAVKIAVIRCSHVLENISVTQRPVAKIIKVSRQT